MNVSHLLKQTIWVAARSGVDGAGKPTYGLPASRAARVEYAQGVAVEGQEGSANTTRATIITLASIGEEDRVWLPGAAAAAAAAYAAAPGNAALAAAAAELSRVPGPDGVQSAPRLTTGTVVFYQTVV